MQKANPCSNCLDYCNAECCRMFVVRLNKRDTVSGNYFKLNIPFDMNLIKYYEYHNCKYFRGTLYIPIEEKSIKLSTMYYIFINNVKILPVIIFAR